MASTAQKPNRISNDHIWQVSALLPTDARNFPVFSLDQNAAVLEVMSEHPGARVVGVASLTQIEAEVGSMESFRQSLSDETSPEHIFHVVRLSGDDFKSSYVAADSPFAAIGGVSLNHPGDTVLAALALIDLMANYSVLLGYRDRLEERLQSVN